MTSDVRPGFALAGILFGALLAQVPAHADFSPAPRWLIEGAPRSDGRKPPRELHTLKDIYAALRRCYRPPPLDQAKPGMRITVQFAFTRDGEIFGKPRILYESPDATPEQQSAYRMAVAGALARCSPLPFSRSLGAAVAGRVLAIQFVDERNLRGA